MRYSPFVVLAILFLCGCERVRVRGNAYSNGTPEASEGFVIRQGDTLRQGLRITWYPDGRRESAESYVDGYLQGYVLHWYPNGRLKSVEHYAQGEGDGQAKFWDADGSLEACYDSHARDCLLAASGDSDPERWVGLKSP